MNISEKITTNNILLKGKNKISTILDLALIINKHNININFQQKSKYTLQTTTISSIPQNLSKQKSQLTILNNKNTFLNSELVTKGKNYFTTSTHSNSSNFNSTLSTKSNIYQTMESKTTTTRTSSIIIDDDVSSYISDDISSDGHVSNAYPSHESINKSGNDKPSSNSSSDFFILPKPTPSHNMVKITPIVITETSTLSENSEFNKQFKLPKLPKDEIVKTREQMENLRQEKVFMARPYHWEELAAIIATNNSDSEKDNYVDLIVRKPADETVYANWNRVLKGKYFSINDYIKITVLGYTSVISKDGGLIMAGTLHRKSGKQVADSTGKYYCILRRNDFPYWLEQGVTHYLLWSLEEIPNDEAKRIIEEKFPSKKYDVLFFTNTPEKKSVKGVPHYQIFVKSK